MKTIAIVSFVDSENYGANLQALALQEKLKDLDYDPIYMNFSRPSSLSGIKVVKNRIWRIIRLLFGYSERLKKTQKFRKNLMNLTTTVYNVDEIENIPPFDIYLVGSDQVWLPNTVSISNGIYFLNFAPLGSKKISYASSFGTINIPKKFDEIYRSNLSGFKAISVREKQGADYLNSIVIKSSVVLDPTLLLNQEEWKRYFDSKPKINKPYILCYVMPGDHKGAKFIKDISIKINMVKKTKYKIIVIGDKEYKKLCLNYHLITNAGPEDFLNYLYNASYIVTNSFHGTCFSLIFKKKFISALHRKNPLNSRITNLLDTIELSDRVIYTDEDISTTSLPNLDIETNSSMLEILREESITYLKESLSKK